MAQKKQPVRMCAGCSQRKAKNEMIRVVRTPEGEILLDRTGKKSGRGAYLCDDPACLAMARKRKALERSFDMTIDPAVFEKLEKEMTQA